MNLINYILTIANVDNNFIMSGITTGLGLSKNLAEWSKSNKDYLLVADNNMLKDDLLANGCEFEAFLCLSTFMKIRSGFYTNYNIDKYVDEGRIIFYEVNILLLLEEIKFKFSLNFQPYERFNINCYNKSNYTVTRRKLCKKTINFNEHKEDYFKIIRRVKTIKTLLDE